MLKNKINELKKISWVKPKDLFNNTLMVLCFTTIMTLLIYFGDLVIASISTIINNLL